ncbi:hypothetical protein D2A34_10165 [Clostridium chromiireducens]|uniref:Peptidase M41 FtsH extracellular domain-containing protein n=1 Tax=Clostridium chromiireducens TaxID=225345 RepID=A0A399IR59_9CLOT|nr:ATP-dependent metallopeptidase FtsH/Yme1/Tma family protein [Clostridium chromiireducens]RII35534.1 hypothetical protein D2A34_10165 [Clostridium chromiireducens]
MQSSKSKYLIISGIVILFLLIFPITIAFNYARDTASTKEISYNEFIRLLDEKQLSKVEVTSEELIITPSEGNEAYKGKILNTPNLNDETLISKLQEAGVEYEGKNLKETSLHNFMIIWIIPIGIICSIIIIPMAAIYFIWRFLSLKKENKRLRIQVKYLLDKK